MLHELLVALSGYSTELFCKTDSKFEIATGISFLHPSERGMIRRLLVLATCCCKVEEFADKYYLASTTPQSNQSEQWQPFGLYTRALCQGLRELLTDYRSHLLQLEQELLADPHLPAAHLQTQLEHYQQLLPNLVKLIEKVFLYKAHGCWLLELVRQHLNSGHPVLQLAVESLLHQQHRVLLRQLSCWLLQGILYDPAGEFFIAKVDSTEEAQLLQVKKEEEFSEYDIGGVTASELNRAMRVSEPSPVDGSQLFRVRAELVPTHFPQRLAESVLFVGQALSTFSVGRRASGESLLGGKEQSLAADMQLLTHADKFSMLALEAVVENVKVTVGERLYDVVVTESRLVAELRLMKDMYLLGRGELFQAFIDQAEALLNVPPVSATQHDVNAAFRLAQRRLMLDEEGLSERFSLLAPVPPASDPNEEVGRESVSGWHVLEMSCSVRWPLHLFFTSTSVTQYSHLFNFLLRVRHAQHALQQVWTYRLSERRFGGSGHTPAAADLLRCHMAFLIDNLQYYLQVDVIESQFSRLLHCINTSRDFQQIRHAHEQFLANLRTQCFLLSKPVTHCLDELLLVCLSLCRLLQSTVDEWDEHKHQRLAEIKLSCARQTGLLYMLLSSAHTHSAAPQLAQLLLRLDFNKYYSSRRGLLAP